MTLDLSMNALLGIAMVCGAICYLHNAAAKRYNASDADVNAWKCWKEVAERALERGQPAPPTPTERPKR